MIRPVAAFVALRYLREHRENHFASFVTVASVLGIGLGVAALIVVLSVMNGFERELRDRLLSMVGHATVSVAPGDDWRAMAGDLDQWAGVVAAAPFIELEGMLSTGRSLAGVSLVGIEPASEERLSGISEVMLEGGLDSLKPGSRSMLLGRALALRLGLHVGDPVTLLVPRKTVSGGLHTGLRQFRVSGIFEFGLQEHDSVRALVHLKDAEALAGLADSVTGIRVRTRDVFMAPEIIRAWSDAWAQHHRRPVVRDWTQDNATYFRAVHIEKLMMTLLLSLIVAVAVFNVVAMLVMTVTDKRGGIAIMRTLGFSRRMVMGVFTVQGLIVGWAGVLFGIALGTGMALNVDTLAPRLEKLFGFQFMPADVYYVTELPSELHFSDVSWIGLLALLMTALASVYPALRAAGVAPAEVLRYE